MGRIAAAGHLPSWSWKATSTGLVHISQISQDHVDKIKDHLKVDQDIEARVIKVDKSERRIGSR